jgi:hypothetical protein
MEKQLGDLLVFAVVGDQPVSLIFQAKFLYQQRNALEKVDQKILILNGDRGWSRDRPFGDDQYVERVSWLWLVKSHQRPGFKQPLDWDQKAQLSEYPGDETTDQPLSDKLHPRAHQS